VSIARALRVFEESGVLAGPVESQPTTTGLINETHFVRDATGGQFVAQRLNPVFDPLVNENIVRVTDHLSAHGVPTYRVVPVDGNPAIDLDEGGVWRLVTRLEGGVFDKPGSRAQVLEAGRAFGSFHRALFAFEEPLHPLGFPFHETSTHLMDLAAALRAGPDHPYYEALRPLAEEVLEAGRNLPRFEALRPRVIHGDPKFNNLLFEGGGEGPGRVCGIIDLDTVSRMPLAYDWGDAMRSWCNRAGEDSHEAQLDLDFVAAAAEGLWSAFEGDEAAPPEGAELQSLSQGLEVISLELCARFAADVIHESYWAWDRTRYESAAEHNLFRARGQLSLFHQAVESRSERERAISS